MSNTYEEEIKRLFERHPSVQSAGFNSDSYKPGLDAMRSFCESLGNPQNTFNTIHVAGTNGKGSVCSMLAASLAGSGLKVGLYTSPHLLDFRERIKICTSAGYSTIAQADVLEFLDRPLGALSFFEITTAMAFWYFCRQKVDIAVIEVGLGGRLDSTNVISPLVSVVTSIGLDHCALLGNTRGQIAFEKAGIFKKDVSAVVWGHDPQTDPVFEQTAVQKGCSALYYASDLYADAAVQTTPLDLEGPCQRQNLATVLCALMAIGKKPCLEAISHAGELTGLHARWEKISTRGKELICDIGHNPPALQENFAKLAACGKRFTIVYGIMADKDLEGIAQYFPTGSSVILCSPSTARAMNCQDLQKRLSNVRPDLELIVAQSVAQAVDMAVCTAPDLIYIGGSTFVVAEAIPEIEKLKTDEI